MWCGECQTYILYGALGVHGYAAGSSKWIYDRWRGWEIAMMKHWAGQHLFKSVSSKKASDIATSDTCFLPSAGISTMAVMALMHRLAFAKAKNGGAGARAAWSSTGSFQGVLQVCIGTAFQDSCLHRTRLAVFFFRTSGRLSSHIVARGRGRWDDEYGCHV